MTGEYHRLYACRGEIVFGAFITQVVCDKTLTSKATNADFVSTKCAGFVALS